MHAHSVKKRGVAQWVGEELYKMDREVFLVHCMWICCVKCSVRDLAPPADFQDGMYQELAEQRTKNFRYH